MLSWETAAFVLAGAAVGGFVNGLAGTGTAMAALPIWLQALEPALAVQLSGACSIAGQLMTIRSIWPDIDWRRLLPLLLIGLAGVPVGIAALAIVPAGAFKLGVGAVLAAYSGIMLAGNGRLRIAGTGRFGDWAAALAGGLFGGLAGLSGAPLAIWASLRGWSKIQRRAVFQMFNLTILAAMLAANAGTGRLAADVGPVLLLAMPVAIVGVLAGTATYRRLSDRSFDRAVLWLLLLAGIGLVATNLR